MPKRHHDRPAADPLEEYLRNITRRRFFGSMATTLTGGLGLTALGSMLNPTSMAGPTTDGLHLPSIPHFAPKAKRVIHLFMNGGPAHMDTFDPKPELDKWDGKSLPGELTRGQKFAFITPDARAIKSPSLETLRSSKTT